MMAKKQKFFKNLLASSAIASIVASLGSSSVAFGGAVLMIDNAALTDTAAGGQNHWNEIDQNGLPVNLGAFIDAPQDNEAFTYGGNFILNANRPDAIITAINLVNHQPGDLTVNENLSIGSIVRNVGGANTLTIKIVAGHTATLTGTPAAKDNHGLNADPNTYTGLGNVELGGVGSTLIVRSFNNEDIAVGNVSTAVHQQGVLTFVTSGSVGAIGADDHRLLTVNIGNVGPRGGGATVTLNGDVYAGEIKFTRATSILKVGGGSTINGNILNAVGRNNRGTLTFLGAGRVIGNIGVDGAALENINIGNGEVTLNGNVYAENTNLTDAASILKLTAGHTITGNVVTTVGDGEGVSTFEGSGGVTGTIGDGHALAEVNFNGAGVVELKNTANATDFNINHKAVNVIATGLMTGKVTFNATGKLKADAGIMGDVDFHGNAGTITLGNGQTITGAVDSTVGEVGKGTLNFAGVGTVTRAIGATKALAEVNFNGAGEVHLRQAASAETFTFNQAATLHAHDDITGNVHFKGYNGIIKLENAKKVTGSVTSTGTGDAKGTLVFLGIGEVTGSITKLKMLRAGAGEVRLAGVNHNITEIQGNGVGNLTFANNFNLEGSINSTGGAAVGLIFKGNNRVTGVVGTAKNPVGTIKVQAGTNIFSNTVQTANDQDIIISNEATAKFANSVTTRNIKGELAGKGTVQFSNAEAITVNSAIGATNAVYTLDIAGADVKITQAVSANYINFSNASKEATLTLEGTSTVGGIRTNGNNVHTLALAADFTTEIQDIGSENNRLKSIKLLGDHKITINSGVYSDISTKTDNTGKVVFNSDRSFAYNLGTNKLRLSDVTFANNATVKGDVYSKQITIASDKTATFAGTTNRTISVPNSTVDGSSLSRSLKSFAYSTQIVSDEIKNEGIAKFDKAVLVDAKITGGKVTFADNVWFKQTADGKEVNFAANKYVILEQNINFANIKADQAKIIILPKTASITGNLAAKDFTVDLAANQLKYTGQAQLTGKIELVTAYDTSSGAGGNIEVQTGSKLDLSKADELTIKVKAQTDINKIPKEGAKYVVISSVNGNGLVAIDHSKIKLDPTGEQNRFVQWSMDSSDLTLYITDISKEVTAKGIADTSLPQEDREFYTQLNNVTDRNSSAAQFMNNIGRMDREHALQAMDRILPGNEHPIGESLVRNPTSEIIGGLIAQADTQITATRMGNSVPMQNAASAVDSENATSAIGSGDDDTLRYGVWGSPFYGTACQETYKGVSGYKSKSAGGIVGFDGLVNDNLLLGAAYSRINTQMSHQDKKIGDKTNGKTNIFSLYSLYNLTNNWFTEAIASYGITRVKNSEGRLIATTKRNVTALETAAAKYKSISYSGQLLTGYNYIASEKLMITPTIGFRYSQFKDAGYTETGTKFQNLVVKKRSYNKFEGILGLRTAATLKANKVLLIPELHGYVNHDCKGKAPIIDARLDGINEPLPTKSVKPVKTFFTVGTGFTAKYNMMECGIIYNVNIASKYIGHQGSLKVKVNF
jgi:outer membrane autotransporter protein